MSRAETQLVLEEIMMASRALVELEPESGEASNLCEALRSRRRTLLDRLQSGNPRKGG